MIQKQDERWEVLENRQYHTDKAVEEHQSDVASFKTVTQEALRDDILGELEVKLTNKEILESGGKSTPLSAFAPEFVPHASSHVLPGSGVGAVLHNMRPQPFDGEAPWDAYKLQFEMLAEINKWSDGEKATFLAVNLRGPALTVLMEGRRTYTTLVAALDNVSEWHTKLN